MPSRQTLATIVLALLAAAILYVRIAPDPWAPARVVAALVSPPPAPPPPMPATPVPVVAVVKRALPVTIDYAARTEAIRNVALQAKVSGFVVEQRADDGADVKQGDLLYRIDSRDYDVALEQAKAQLDRDAASLEYLKSNLDRGADLAEKGYLSKDVFDQRASAARQAEASLAIDRAAIRAAELNRAYTEIRAPFAGRLGRNQAAVGTLIGAGGAVLNTLVEIDPLYVVFNPSETDLAQIQKARSQGEVTAEVFAPGATDGRKGVLTFLDNSVDRSTGTIVARATIANAALALLPGQYVRLRLLVGEEPDTLMAPQASLGSSQMGKYIYVVGDGDRVEMRPVTVGRSDGDLIAVLSGLKETDRVISGNLQKIGPGLPVRPMTGKMAASN
jgi:multidrug efflux system membrane fusion protein